MVLEDILSSSILAEWINQEVLEEENLKRFQESFQSATPFKHLYIDNLLKEEKLEHVIDELAEQEFEMKEADLFQLAQTPDFDDLDVDVLSDFKDLLRHPDFLNFMSYITGLELSSDVDCLGNIYQDTDYLLCHDDKLIKRKIAYILYLTDLKKEDGGGLHLYDSIDGKQPNEIVKKIYPQQNRFTFFKVTRQSFHEVGEVLQPDTFRVSISGWFNNE